ncbi:hypothetical protein [Cellulomonas pakistanensis]|uniref:hypothetical protein n=1 Tax=Cellulomonas pakistanensis TaxID=992287 RepID=UPI0019426E7D|nr:hypothetical protein [Cellulomonas pakistanensis]
MSIAGWQVVARAERERTDTQVLTLRAAVLGEDATDVQRRSGPDKGGWLGHYTNGMWGQARVGRTAEDVLRDLATGADSAGVDEPECIAPDHPPEDVLDFLSAVYVCDITRNGWSFGSVEVTPMWVEPGKDPQTAVVYGFGPDAGGRLHKYRG